MYKISDFLLNLTKHIHYKIVRKYVLNRNEKRGRDKIVIRNARNNPKRERQNITGVAADSFQASLLNRRLSIRRRMSL